MDCNRPQPQASASGGSPSSVSSYASSPGTPMSSEKAAGKQKETISPHSFAPRLRRPSLLSAAISAESCKTINIGDDGAPRLIAYVASSQGFTWNPEIFVPSYIEGIDHRGSFEHGGHREPVHEIWVSDEEVRKMMPQ